MALVIWAFAVMAFGAAALPVAAQTMGETEAVDPLAPLSAEESATPRTVRPERLGYAFDNPGILLRQRLIGLAHGLRLLGKTCLLDSAYSLATEKAYGQWYRQQAEAINAMSRDLERWYFGGEVEPDPQARLREVIRLIGLRPELRKLNDEERNAICASYPQAIVRERYDFARQLDEAAREQVDANAGPAHLPVEEPASSSGAPTVEPVNDPVPVTGSARLEKPPPAVYDDSPESKDRIRTPSRETDQ